VATSDALLKDVRLTVCVDPHFAQSIYDLADDSDRTVSWMMRKLIEVGLGCKNQPPTTARHCVRRRRRTKTPERSNDSSGSTRGASTSAINRSRTSDRSGRKP